LEEGERTAGGTRRRDDEERAQEGSLGIPRTSPAQEEAWTAGMTKIVLGIEEIARDERTTFQVIEDDKLIEETMQLSTALHVLLDRAQKRYDLAVILKP